VKAFACQQGGEPRDELVDCVEIHLGADLERLARFCVNEQFRGEFGNTIERVLTMAIGFCVTVGQSASEFRRPILGKLCRSLEQARPEQLLQQRLTFIRLAQEKLRALSLWQKHDTLKLVARESHKLSASRIDITLPIGEGYVSGRSYFI
jgi:hypothetical protein